ncbi:aminotransferase class III-fold pyridoxal phosphate-dependent enzyme [Streptomyces sp. NPDC046215]|uniref:Aminotransferase class III-fold pyridoxal phosphate-dependent enzyme n=1 Tax=Streptomyces stramineus TaxID=173861 RepID=A0ABN0ZW39_9ACTN
MSPVANELELAEPHLGGVLSAAGLDAEYVRAAGNTLYLRGADGQEIPVLDFAGGFGSLMLGHNNPEITAYTKSLLDAQVPVHSQFSRHPCANRVAQQLNAILQRELDDDEPYFAIFANSGAEAIEVAVKHAEFERSGRLAALAEEVAAHVESARAAVREGAALAPTEAGARLEAARRAGDAEGFEGLLAALARENAERLARSPLFLTLEGSFHGKLASSVQLTHNESFRLPFKALAAQARFVPRDRPEAVKEIIEEERATVFDLSVEGDTVTVTERDFPIFGAFLLEPVQGEGGVRVITEEFARAIQDACAAIDCPIVVDEIQSGMGRTGAFLASSLIGLRGDYYTLAKSLGGGLAKVSVTLVRRPRYRQDFELVHSSTFAKDSFSSHIALKVLEIMEAEDGRIYRMARERGTKLVTTLEALRADFPDVIKDVRGKGLMLGLEFHDQSTSESPAIQGVSQAGFLGYTVAGFALREHRIRLFPTGSAFNTLRLQPSVYLSDEEIARLDAALRDVCGVLREQDGERLTGGRGE